VGSNGTRISSGSGQDEAADAFAGRALGLTVLLSAVALGAEANTTPISASIVAKLKRFMGFPSATVLDSLSTGPGFERQSRFTAWIVDGHAHYS